MTFVRAAVVTLLIAQPALAERPTSLATVADRSHDLRTGRYEEIQRLCPAYQRQWPDQVRCVEFGRTPEGRPMLALVASADGVLEAAQARRRERPVVLMQGGIHAGEPDGKDAGMRALREMLQGAVAAEALRGATLVFAPALNVDGHERFGPWNRPNQTGPEEMGWRTTAQNYNLNRDYVKAEAPEMQAMLRLLNEWDPVMYVDLHVTNGAKFEHDISYNIAPTLAGDPALRASAAAVLEELMDRAEKWGSLPLDFYPSFVREDDPSSGFAADVGPKRFSHEYWAARNRIGVLVETHSWKNYPTRVRITRNTIIALLEMAARDGGKWMQAARGADARAAEIGGSIAALTYENTDDVRTIDFRGYQYVREPSAISGALVTRYDDRKPQIWRVPLRYAVRPGITVAAPRGGYIVPAAYAERVAEKLSLHGIQYRKLETPVHDAQTETFRATAVNLAPATFEGRPVMTLEGEWRPEQRDAPAGSLFVPIAQPAAHIVLTLFEPRDPDSLASWGFFAAAFEPKEYMEAYVAEEVAVEMLEKDPQLARQFAQRLAEDGEFAKSPAARLEFFYRRHPSWDERLNLYPVYRVERSDW
ncbi:MAG TPA: M14 family metallopeptidase [Steroidobacter sp.]|nr:M14 family metallopeptidase [Steroidobacter sp.]